MSSETLSFPAAKASDLGLKLFIGFHALSVASVIFAGWLGFGGATSDQMMAVAALISIVASLGLTFIVHKVIKSSSRRSDDPDILRLTADGVEGRALAERGLSTIAWSRLTGVDHDAAALTLYFTPSNPDSDHPHERMSAVRVPIGPTASAAQMAAAVRARMV